MSTDAFKAKLAASREKWINVGESREILFRRPSYATQCVLRDKASGDESYMLAVLSESAKDWRGFTADYILPGEPSEQVAFDTDLLQAVFDDSYKRAQIVGAFVEFWVSQAKEREQAEKN